MVPKIENTGLKEPVGRKIRGESERPRERGLIDGIKALKSEKYVKNFVDKEKSSRYIENKVVLYLSYIDLMRVK